MLEVLLNHVRTLRKDFKLAVKVAKVAHEQSVANEWAEQVIRQPDVFWRRFRKKHSQGHGPDAFPSLATFQQHFADLYAGNDSPPLNEEQVQQVGAQMRDWHAAANGVHSVETADALMRRRARDAAGMGLGDNLAVTEAEVTAALRNLRNNKASGVDRMPAECLKYARVDLGQDRRGRPIYHYILAKPLTDLFNRIIDTRDVPQQWDVSLLTPLYKGKGDASQCNNFRGIAVTCVLAKMFSSILETKISRYLEQHSLRAVGQAGFRQKLSTLHPLFTVAHLQAVHCTASTSPGPLYVCLVDFVKAFDMVQRPLLWERLGGMGLHGKTLDTIRHLYQQVSMRVKLDGKISDVFNNVLGVKQGDPLSPTLFGAFIEVLPEFYQAMAQLPDHDGLLDSCPSLEGLMVFYLFYADDMMLMSRDPCKLQQMLDALSTVCNSLRMQVNISKTEILVFNVPGRQTPSTVFTYQGRPLRITLSAKYLGMWFSSEGKQGNQQLLAEAATRAANMLRSTLNRMGTVTPALQLQLFNTLVRPTLAYGCQVWAVPLLRLPKPHAARGSYHPDNDLERVQIAFVRSTLGLGSKSFKWCAMHDAGMDSLQVFWLRAILRFWNGMRDSENALVTAACKADLRLVSQRIKKSWSYALCHFLAQLGKRMDAPVFDEPYQSALMSMGPLPEGMHNYLWQYTMDVNHVCDLLDSFWRNQVLQGADLRQLKRRYGSKVCTHVPVLCTLSMQHCSH